MITIINILLGRKKCLFRHKWRLGRESIRYVRTDTGSSGDDIHRIEDVRYCTRCSKKQRKAFSHIFSSSDWTDWYLTKDEERDKKLNDIGI